MRTTTRSLWLSLVAASLCSLWLAPAASAVTIDWVTVGDPLNIPCDMQGSDCFGTVAQEYRISKYEVTNAQYAEFLTAKAGASDLLDLYDPNMDPIAGLNGGITQSGSTYTAVLGRESMPVNWVSLYDTLRFANWLNNGQVGGDTETGAYMLLGNTPTPTNGPTVTRDAGATIFLPSEDEWYKAAYYDVVTTSYNTYPFADGFNGAACESPGTTTHSANCDFPVGSSDLTNVGSYTGPSPNGTFDQGGNVFEWTEAITGLGNRVLRGGSFISPGAGQLAAASQSAGNPGDDFKDVGFRVASPIPEPGTGLLVMTGVLGLAGWRRRRA